MPKVRKTYICLLIHGGDKIIVWLSSRKPTESQVLKYARDEGIVDEETRRDDCSISINESPLEASMMEKVGIRVLKSVFSHTLWGKVETGVYRYV